MNKDFYMILEYDTLFGNLINSTVRYLTSEEAEAEAVVAFGKSSVNLTITITKLTPMEAVEHFTTLLCNEIIFDLEEAIESEDLFGTVELIIDNLTKFTVLDYIG